jgi:RNase P subunit RPR2
MWKSNKVAGLLDKKQKIEREIRKIQKNCKHPTKSLKQIRERVDSDMTVIRWVCDECSMIVGYPNEWEEEKYFKE